MASPQQASKAGRQQPPPPRIEERTRSIWNRVTEGLELTQLWAQFKNEAQTGYLLYSREVDRDSLSGTTRGRRFRKIAASFFWAVLTKLSPARRIVLLLGVFLLISPIALNVFVTTFSPDSLHVFGGLVILALLLLEVADRVTLKRDLQIAREIQTWLIPQTAPSVPELDVAFFNRPANTVAGDYYDVFRRKCLNDGRQGPFLIAMADVAGKSLPAALLMATFHASLHTLSVQSESFVELVGGLNRFACEHSSGGQRFTTAFLAEYDPDSGALTYINAGHNAPILLRASGDIVRLEKGGLPLGIMLDAAYESASVLLRPDDLLFVFTDGLIEAVNSAGEEYGEDRLIANLVANRQCHASEIIVRINRVLDSFVAMTPQHDDISSLVARKL
jgi:sigma-B regulation protein RsbU (phosphoserine phosphatase)